jgi:hypothetical protein
MKLTKVVAKVLANKHQVIKNFFIDEQDLGLVKQETMN